MHIRRLLVISSLSLLAVVVLLIRHLLDLGAQYSALTDVRNSTTKVLWQDAPNNPPAVSVEAEDKIIVMARTESQDTSWVASGLASCALRVPYSILGTDFVQLAIRNLRFQSLGLSYACQYHSHHAQKQRQ